MMSHKLKLLFCCWKRDKHTSGFSPVDQIYIWQFQPSAPWMKSVTLDYSAVQQCIITIYHLQQLFRSINMRVCNVHIYHWVSLLQASGNKWFTAWWFSVPSCDVCLLLLRSVGATVRHSPVAIELVFIAYICCLFTAAALFWCNRTTQSRCCRNRQLPACTPYSVPIHYSPISHTHTELTYLLTYSMEQSPSWEANRFCS